MNDTRDHGTKRVHHGGPRYGFGARHIQIFCMFVSMTTLFVGRFCISVGILAMTDIKRGNESNITAYSEIGGIRYHLHIGMAFPQLLRNWNREPSIVGQAVYDWDKKTQNTIMSSFFLGYSIMQIPGGMLAKRFGGKTVITVILVINGLLCLFLPLLAKMGGWVLVCIARLGMGLAQGCLYPSSHTLLGRWIPAQERTLLSGIVYGGKQMGTIIAMPMAGILAESAVGWPLIYYTVGGMMFLSAGLWCWMSASSPDEHRYMTQHEKAFIEKELNVTSQKDVLQTPWRQILLSKEVWALVAAHAAGTNGFMLFFVDLPTYLERGLNMSIKKSAFLSALPFVGMWVGGVVSSTVCETLYNRKILSLRVCRKMFNTISLTGNAVGLVLLSLLGPQHQTLAIITITATLFCSAFFTAGYLVGHLDLSPNYAGVLLGLTNTAANTSGVLQPILTSFILRNDPTDVTRWRIVFLVIAGMCCAGNIVFLLWGGVERKPWDDPHFMNTTKYQQDQLKPLKVQSKEDNILKIEGNISKL